MKPIYLFVLLGLLPGLLPAQNSSGGEQNGLSKRTVMQRPIVSDTSARMGKVVVSICVDRDGNVISAEYNPRGSTTADSELCRKAIDAARQYRFAPSAEPRACGTISFDFKLKYFK
jgi:TonB family protein